ncbi:toxin glutamine deamidase domain-containing protein [Streptomyces sp. NPDC047315]|uniref:toxin glutamine deamidase domain-containing protein n=1 Tax=Streptomyces sp. NPDC047315 TaxID=3155142 RepID=UPI0033DC7E6F
MHENEPSKRSHALARAPLRPPAPTKDPAGPAAPGLPRGAADVLALQRSAGNAAVTRALEAGRPARAAAPGHDLPVQRALAEHDREFGPGRLDHPRSADQQNLERVFPKNKDGSYEQFPDPTTITNHLTSLMGSLNQRLSKVPQPQGPQAGSGGAADWVVAINSQRDVDDRYKRNCIDAARSFLASWSGTPTVAAPVYDPTGVEEGGTGRTKEWLNAEWKTSKVTPGVHPLGREDWDSVASRLKSAGHGSSSIVVFMRKQSGNVHAVNGVNIHGKVKWIDPQYGVVSSQPLYDGLSFMTITLDPQANPV